MPMTPSDRFVDFCYAQRQRIGKYLAASDRRIANARRQSRQGAHDEWRASRPGCVGYASGARKPNLDEIEGGR